MEIKDIIGALNGMGLSLESIALSFRRKKTVISYWKKGERTPDMNIQEFYEGVRDCQITLNMKDMEFIYCFLNALDYRLDIKENLKDIFQEMIEKLKGNIAAACHDFLFELIQDAYTQREWGKETLAYDVKNHIRPVIAIGHHHVLSVMENGCVKAFGVNDDQQLDIEYWRNIVSVAVGHTNSFGLKKNKTCIAIGKDAVRNGDVFGWKNIIAIASGSKHVAALQEDGRVAADGLNRNGQCDISQWRDICAICCGSEHTVGLKKDGTVLAVGDHRHGQCDVQEWKDVIFITAGTHSTAALTKDGRVLATGLGTSSFHTENWQDVHMIAVGDNNLIGLKKDGTVLVTGSNMSGINRIGRWKNVVAIYGGGYNYFAGLKRDGTLYVHKDNTSILTWNAGTAVESWKLFEGEAIPDEEDIDLFYRKVSALHALITGMFSYANSFKKYLIGEDYFNRQDKIGFMDVIHADLAVDLLSIAADKIKEMKAEFQSDPLIGKMIDDFLAAFQDFYATLEKKPFGEESISYICTALTEEKFVRMYQLLWDCETKLNEI